MLSDSEYWYVSSCTILQHCVCQRLHAIVLKRQQHMVCTCRERRGAAAVGGKQGRAGVQRLAATRTSRRTGHSIQYCSHACVGAARDGALSPILRSCARRSGGICFCQLAEFLQHGMWQQIMYFSPRLWLLQRPTWSFTRAEIWRLQVGSIA
jgi:hypothetical protein